MCITAIQPLQWSTELKKSRSGRFHPRVIQFRQAVTHSTWSARRQETCLSTSGEPVQVRPPSRPVAPTGPLRVCYVGSLDLRKGFIYLLRAGRIAGPTKFQFEFVPARWGSGVEGSARQGACRIGRNSNPATQLWLPPGGAIRPPLVGRRIRVRSGRGHELWRPGSRDRPVRGSRVGPSRRERMDHPSGRRRGLGRCPR